MGLLPILQIGEFQFPKDIEVDQLELLAKEIVLNANAVASKGRSLKKWKPLSEIVNALKSLENAIYGAYGSSEDVLVELVRIAHRQFIWQGNPPNSASARLMENGAEYVQRCDGFRKCSTHPTGRN